MLMSMSATKGGGREGGREGGRARGKLARPCHFGHLPYPRRRAPFAHMRIVPCQVGREGGKEGGRDR